MLCLERMQMYLPPAHHPLPLFLSLLLLFLLHPFILSSPSLPTVFRLMFLTPFNLNLACRLSSALHSLFAFGLTLRADVLPLGEGEQNTPVESQGIVVPETRPSQRAYNEANRKGDMAHTIGGTLWGYNGNKYSDYATCSQQFLCLRACIYHLVTALTTCWVIPDVFRWASFTTIHLYMICLG